MLHTEAETQASETVHIKDDDEKLLRAEQYVAEMAEQLHDTVSSPRGRTSGWLPSESTAGVKEESMKEHKPAVSPWESGGGLWAAQVTLDSGRR